MEILIVLIVAIWRKTGNESEPPIPSLSHRIDALHDSVDSLYETVDKLHRRMDYQSEWCESLEKGEIGYE